MDGRLSRAWAGAADQCQAPVSWPATPRVGVTGSSTPAHMRLARQDGDSPMPHQVRPAVPALTLCAEEQVHAVPQDARIHLTSIKAAIKYISESTETARVSSSWRPRSRWDGLRQALPDRLSLAPGPHRPAMARTGQPAPRGQHEAHRGPARRAASLDDGDSSLELHNPGRYLLDRVAAVAQPVPPRLPRLGVARHVGSPSADGDRARPVNSREQLPRPPAVVVPFTQQVRWLPGTVADTHLDSCKRCGTRPGDAPDGLLAALEFGVR